MSQFKEVMADFSQLSSLALKGAVTVPWIDIWLKIGPPPAKSTAVLTSLFEFLVVIWGFNFWSNMDVGRLNHRMKAALGIFCVGLVSSLFLTAVFTVSPGEGRERVIKGWILRDDVRPLISTSFPAEQALRDSEYDANTVWTAASIATMRILITAIWLCTFSSLAGYLVGFIIIQRRRSP